MRNCRGQVSELQLSLSTTQQTISELHSQEARDWVILRDEIKITEKCLGRGGWGIVNEGTYCGCSVAVKQIHELILSPHNINLFEREMNIASKCAILTNYSLSAPPADGEKSAHFVGAAATLRERNSRHFSGCSTCSKLPSSEETRAYHSS